MTPQEIFDKAVLGVLKQGKRSVKDTHQCAYRGDGGLKCAVGFLIDDDDLARRMDDYGDDLHFLLAGGSLKSELPNFLYEHRGLLCALQKAHDRLEHWDIGTKIVAAKFCDVAAEYNLSTTAIDQWQAEQQNANA